MGDEVDCLVSPDGVNWHSLITWTWKDDDLDYQLVSVDIPLSDMSATTHVKFDSLMSSPSDHFNFDLIKIVGRMMVFEIVSTTGDVTTTAVVEISDEGEVTVLHWETEVTS